MIKNIIIELKINFKKPFVLILFACSTLFFSFFAYDNFQQEKNINEKYLMESNYHGQYIETDGDLYEMMEGYKPSIYKEAKSVSFRAYLNRKEDLHTLESYETEILYYQLMIELMEEYNYHSSLYTVEEYERKIEEFQYLIDHEQKHQIEENMTSIHSFVQYNKEFFFILLILISMLVGCFSISEEIETGSLKTMVVQPLSRSKYILSKMIAVSLTNLIILFVPIILISFGLLFIKGMGDFFYPYVTFSNGIYTIIPEGKVMLLYLIFDVVLCVFVNIVSFLFSYCLKDSISAFLMAVFVFVMPYMVVNVALMGIQYAHLIYSTYYHPVSILNGEVLIQTGNMQINLYLGMWMMLVLSAVCMFIVMLNFKSKDLHL